MKANIHPKWNHQAKVTCACGNQFLCGSMQDEIRVDICNTCHPFYTGSMKFVDIQGRVDRFEKLRQTANALKSSRSQSKQAKIKKAEPKSLREMLEEEKRKLVTAAA